MNFFKKSALLLLCVSTGSVAAKSHLEKAFIRAAKHFDNATVTSLQKSIVNPEIFGKAFKKAAKAGNMEACELIEAKVPQVYVDKGIKKAAKKGLVTICQRFWKLATPLARMKAKARLGAHRTPVELEKLNLDINA